MLVPQDALKLGSHHMSWTCQSKVPEALDWPDVASLASVEQCLSCGTSDFQSPLQLFRTYIAVAKTRLREHVPFGVF